ncbi:MAG TPA: glycoside hydrolase family 88 protein [Cyclobacteriaceae bacterium]|nr:glycoside hydrolase family 88 protein [Cyclobacteriaceae bacterium]
MRPAFLIPFAFLFSCACSTQEDKSNDLMAVSVESLEQAVQQYKAMDKSLPDSLFPRSVRPDSTLWMVKSDWWTTGFFPGSLWYLYEYSGDPLIMEAAQARTTALRNEQFNDRDHDLGFKMYCSFGNGLRITSDSSYVPVLLTAAKTLIKRFDPKVGCIRSWGDYKNTTDPYLVIIDNMMNLELLFWATKQSGDSSFYNVAIAHADTTLHNHFRPDGSSYHVVEYDPQTGHVLKKRTAQGSADESAWARGQAWGLYGYTMSYRETGYKRYLDHAEKIANFLLNHPNLPEDKIPYWDFNAPNIPDALRDASAAAIMASALLELSTFTKDDNRQNYFDSAEKILLNLSKDDYRSKSGENSNFLLKHGVGHIPEKSEVDVPLSYADYYYIEGLLRYRKMKSNSANLK